VISRTGQFLIGSFLIGHVGGDGEEAGEHAMIVPDPEMESETVRARLILRT